MAKQYMDRLKNQQEQYQLAINRYLNAGAMAPAVQGETRPVSEISSAILSQRSPVATRKLNEYETYKKRGGVGLSDETLKQLGSTSFYLPEKPFEGVQGTYNPTASMQAYKDRYSLINKYRTDGIWDVAGNSPSLFSDDYLASQIADLNTRLTDSKAADEADKQKRKANAETAARLKALSTDYYHMNSYDELLDVYGGGSDEVQEIVENWLALAKLQDANWAGPRTWDELRSMEDDEAYREMLEQLHQGWNNADWNNVGLVPAYESQTEDLQRQMEPLQKEQDYRTTMALFGSLAESAQNVPTLEAYYQSSIPGYNPEVYDPEYAADLIYFLNHAVGGQEKNLMEALNDGFGENLLYGATGISLDEDARTVQSYYDRGYNMLQPEELAIVDRMVNQPEAIQAFLNAMEPTLLARRAEYMETETQMMAQDPLMAALMSAATVASGPVSSVASILGGLAGADPNHPVFDATRDSAVTRMAVGENLGEALPINVFGEELGTTIYNVGMSMFDMLYARKLGKTAAGGVPDKFAKNAMQTIMSSEVAANTIYSDLQAGYTHEQAVFHGAANGLIEAFYEKGFMDELFNFGKGFAPRMFSAALAEAGEEVGTEITQTIGDELLAYMTGRESEVNQVYQQNLAAGMDSTQAALATMKHYGQQVALAGLSGFAMGSGVAGVSGVSEIAAGNYMGNSLRNQGDVEAMLKIAESMEESSAARTIAEKLRKKQQKGKKISNYDLGQLVTEVSQGIGEEGAKVVDGVLDEAVENRLVELGEDAGNAKALAPVIRKITKGTQVKPKERRAVNWSDAAEQVVKELNTAEAEGKAEAPTWTKKAAEKATHESLAVEAKRAQVREAMESKTTTTTAVSKAHERAKGMAKNKPRLGEKMVAFADGASGQIKQAKYQKVIEKNGRLYAEVQLDGQKETTEVAVEDLDNVGSEGLSTILNYAAYESRHDMSAEEVNAMAAAYELQGGDVDSFVHQFEDNYLAGYSGIKEAPTDGVGKIAYEQGRTEAARDEETRLDRARKMRSNANPTVGWLGDVDTDQAVKGQGDNAKLDKAVNTMTEGQQLVVEFARNLSANTGLNVALFRSKAGKTGNYNVQNGSYDSSTHTIYLDINAGVNSTAEMARMKEQGTLGYAIMRTLGHEVTHAIEATSTQYYDEYKQAVKKELTAGKQDWAQLVRRKLDNAIANGQKLTYAGAEAEVVADASEYMLQDSQFVKNMDAGLKNKVKRFMQDFIGKIRAAFKALTGGHGESMALRTMRDGVMQYSERLQKLWDAGFMEMATTKVRESQIAEEGRPTQKQVRETAYDYSAPFAQQVDDWVDGKIPERDTLLLGRTPSVLREIGFSDLPMTIDQKHMRYMLGEPKNADHDLGIDIVKRLPELVSNPVAIIANPAPNKGNRTPGVMIIFAEKNKNANGRRIVGAVSVLENGKINGITIDSTRLETAHSRGDVDKKIADAVLKERNGGYGVYYINKNALSLLEPSQSQVLGTLGHEGVIHSIREAPEFVNSKFLEQTDTTQFRRWFEGSKIVNEDGTAKVMYHGTPYGGFTAFKDWQYFTDNKEYADKYHNPSASSIRGRYNPATNPQTYEVYLSVKKPFDTRDPKTRKIWRNEFYESYSRTPLSDRGLPDWTDGIDLIDFIEENDYDYDAIILDEGGVGGYGDDVQDRGISVVVRSSNQIKSATDNVGTFDTQNPDIRYSRRDTEYMDAVRTGDASTARQLVAEAAKAAGYKPLRLYHGTRSFGFTKFDVGKSDDKMSIFVTDNLRIAESYSGENVNRNLKHASKEDRYEFLQKPSIELLPYVQEHLYEPLRIPTDQEVRAYTDEASATIWEAFDAIGKYLEAHEATLSLSAKQALVLMQIYAEKMAKFMTLDMEDVTDGYQIRMKYEDARLDLSFEDRDAYDALYDVAERPVIEAANKLLQVRFSDPFYNEKTKKFVSKWDVTEKLGDAIFSGIYDLYGMDDNMFVMDANDANWNTLDGSAIGRDGVFVNTRAVAEYAKNNGYNGVVIKNVRDGGGMTPYHGSSNVFVYFNNTALKSADMVTYDDAGNVIPLSQRFNTQQEDIRYSRRDEAPDGVSIREFLGSMKPTERMTETEKLLLKRYQENLRTLEEKEKLVAEQEEIIRTAPIKSDELTMAKNRHQIYRTQANRAARALMDAERSEGFARVMATSQEVVNRYLLGSAGAVGDAADVLDEEIAGLTAQLKAVEADVTRTASGQRTAFARGLFDQKQLNDAAKRLKETYGSRMSVKTIADRLALAYGEIFADNSAEGAKLFMAAAHDLAEDILRGNKYRYKSEILPMLAEQIGTISLSETDVQEIRNAGMTLSEYKRMLSPYIRVTQGGSGLSSYASNAEYYGEGALASVLGEDIEGNLALRLYDVISREKEQEAEISYEGMSEGQLIAEAMADIAGSNLPIGTGGGTIEYLRKELLKYAGESAEAAQKVEQAIMNAQAATRRASGVWRAAVKEVDTAKQAVEYYRKLEEQRRLTELKEQKQEITAQLRSDYTKKLEEKVQKQREEYRAREQKAREYRHTRVEVEKLRRRIGRNVKRLNTLRMRETDQKHVPQKLKQVADAVMQTFTDSSLSKLAFSAEKTASLARRYRLLQEVESDMTYFWDDEIEAYIENLKELGEAYTAIREREGGVPSVFSLEGVQLETEILQGVDNIVSNVLQMIDSENDAFLTGRTETFNAFANQTGNELLKHDDAKVLKGKLGDAQMALDEWLRTGNVTPVYFFDHLRNGRIKEVYDEIRRGQTEYGRIIHESQNFMQETRAKYHYGSWADDGKLTMTTSQGHKLTLTKEQAMWIYATAKREQSNKLFKTEHLASGGFQYKDTSSVAEGIYRATDKPHTMNEADVAKVGKWLTDEQKAYADEVVGFLSNQMADYGNKASMAMFGYKKFTEKYYFPFQTKADQRFQKGDEGAGGENAGTGRVKNSGFTKKLQNGANATLLMDDFSQVAADHMQKMATYAAMVQPIENLKRLMNHKVVEDDGTIQTIRALIGQKYGRPSERYMQDFLKDLNGATQNDSRASKGVDYLIGSFKRGAVLASASVVLQQPTAAARAMAYISPKYFRQNPFYRPSKGTWEELMKYSGTAIIKDMGKFDVGLGLTASEYIVDEHLKPMKAYHRLKGESKLKGSMAAAKRAMDWLTSAPGAADQWTWGIIWKAVKAEQAALNPSMNTSSEEFLQMCGQRFDDVIDHTQVYDSVLTRSSLMRSKNAFHKMATSFMSEPTLSINMLYDMVMGDHDKKKRAAIFVSVMLSQVLAGAMAALVQAWNDDDDKRNWAEKYADRATSNILSNINPLGMIPYVSDVMSMLEGYDVERPDMSTIKDLMDYSGSFIKKAWDPEQTLGWKDYENFIGTWANMLGVPAKNISRELRRTRNAVVNTDWSAPDGFNVGQAVLENVPRYDSRNAAYYERIVAAELRGDMQRAEDYREYMLNSKMVSEDAMQTGLKKAMQERFIGGYADEDTATKYLLEIGACEDEDEAHWEIDKWKWMQETGGRAGDYRKYGDFYEAIASGENLKATIQEYLDNGVEKSTLAAQITSHYKEQMIELYATDKKEFANLQARLLTAYAVLGYDRADKQKDIQKWLKKTK